MSRWVVIIPLPLQTYSSFLSSHFPDRTGKIQLFPLHSTAHTAGKKHKITRMIHLRSLITDQSGFLVSYFLQKIQENVHTHLTACLPHMLEPSPSHQPTLTALAIRCALSHDRCRRTSWTQRPLQPTQPIRCFPTEQSLE